MKSPRFSVVECEGQILIVPSCGVCGKVITDFQRANVIFKVGDGEACCSIEGAPAKLVGRNVFIVHKGCDPRDGYLWTPLDSILRSDQRTAADGEGLPSEL